MRVSEQAIKTYYCFKTLAKMSGYDEFAARKGAGKRKHNDKETKKETRQSLEKERETAARAAADAAAKERAREARRARAAADDAESRRRHEEHKKWNREHKEVAGGATTLARLPHLQTLGLKPEQDKPELIRRAHRKMALKYHPDKNSSPEAPELFRRIQAAFDALAPPAA